MMNVSDDVSRYMKERIERHLNDIMTAGKYSHMHDSSAACFESACIALDMGIVTINEWKKYLDRKRNATSRRIHELSNLGMQSSPVDADRY